MKAKMKNNLASRFIALVSDVIDMPDAEELAFLNSIDGKEVELVFIGDDAFEKNDNNYWLPNELWDEIEPTLTKDQQRMIDLVDFKGGPACDQDEL